MVEKSEKSGRPDQQGVPDFFAVTKKCVVSDSELTASSGSETFMGDNRSRRSLIPSCSAVVAAV